MTAMTHHEMIVQADPRKRKSRAQPPHYLDEVVGQGRIDRGMIMNEDER